jgi:16S rRNA (guanine1207-N2)-methyltransferase
VYLELATDAGMFSPGRLDPGTRLLLDEAARPAASGDLLDLGCGYGPIACVLAARSPGATVWAVDVNERALELCARNAAAAGLANVRCVTPRTLPCPPASPGSGPTRRSGSASRRCTSCFGLARPPGPGGQAHLVVGRNLGADSLHHWLAEQGWP